MGIVHAKTENDKTASSRYTIPEAKISYDQYEPTETKEIELDAIKARVDKVHVEGLSRTKDDIVEDCISELFEAVDFQDVLLKAHRARVKLDELGCFKNIGVFIDTSKGPKSTNDGLEITFNVKEHKRVVGGVSTQVGNNEGALMIGLRAPNLLGRGERIQVEYSHGSKGTSNFNIAYVKPFRGKRRPMLTASIFQTHAEWPPSGYKQIGQGFLFDFGFYSLPVVKHNLQYEWIIRNIEVLSRSSAFETREEAGANLKSAIRHSLSMDFRDDVIFPSCGTLFHWTTEIAGVGMGNVGFHKNDVFLQGNYSLAEDWVIQATLAGGLMGAIGNDMKLTISDLYFLGGPTSVRGFQTRGVGPHNDGDASGAQTYWAAGLHLFTPLPFRPGKGGFGELFRTHLFLNGGNIGNFREGNFIDKTVANIRLSYGLGLALRLGNMARVEVNYCFPVSSEKGDVSQSGVQFGIGLQFL